MQADTNTHCHIVEHEEIENRESSFFLQDDEMQKRT